MSRFTEQTDPPTVLGLNNGPGSGTSPVGQHFVLLVVTLLAGGVFARLYDGWLSSLPKTWEGVPVGSYWNNGGVPTRVTGDA